MSSRPCMNRFKNADKNIWIRIEQTLLPASVYGMLAVTAFWALCLQFFTKLSFSIGFINNGLFIVTGISGAWHHVDLYNKRLSTKLCNFHRSVKFISLLYNLPLLLSDLYIKYNFSNELIIAHLILPLLALVPYGSNLPQDKTLLAFKKYYYPPNNAKVKDTLDFVVFCSVVALSMVSTLGNNLFGIAAAFVYAVTHFVVTEEGYVDLMKMPAEPIYVSGLGVFCLLGMRAMIA